MSPGMDVQPHCLGWTFVHDNGFCWLKSRPLSEIMREKVRTYLCICTC